MTLKHALAAALALVVLTSIPSIALAAPWTYTDGSGNTVSLDETPVRIVAHANAAAGLIAFGIRPVGIFVDGPVETDMSLSGLDLTGIEIVGEAWGEIDVEKVAALEPDLIIAEWWPNEEAYSGLEPNANGASKQIMELAPIVGVEQGLSIVKMIEDYEGLAASLGADLAAPEIAAERARFEAALVAFKAAVAAKPNLTVEAVWAGADGLYVALPAASAELSDFKAWGMSLIEPDAPDENGYWETLSWENADKYQPDLIIVDDRFASTREAAEAQPMWTSLKAAAAGAVTDWPAYWMRNYTVYANELEALTATIAAADENLVE